MWTASISRIALSTSLAVAGGLSLVGVLASLPSQDPAPAQPASVVSGPSTALDSASLQGGPGVAVRQTPELAQAIDNAEAILAQAPSAGPTLGQAETTEGDGPWSGTLAPDDELGNLAPAAGRPAPNAMAPDAAPSMLAEQPAEAAAASVIQEPARTEPRQTAERLPLDGDAGTGSDSNSDTNSDEGAVAGAYMSSTMHEGAQSETGAAAAQPAKTAADAGQVAAKQAAAPATDPEAIGFVIIGSFRHHENAARHVGDHRDWLPQILTKQLGGTTQYRVAVGPFRVADLSAARQRVIASGIADAWLLPLGKAAAAPLQTLDILG